VVCGLSGAMSSTELVTIPVAGVTWVSTWMSLTPGSLGGWKTTSKGGGLSGAMADKAVSLLRR